MARRMIVLNSTLAPEALVETLRRKVGETRWSLSPLAKMDGAEFVGGIEGSAFYIRRHGHSGDNFASQFYGRVEAAQDGTKIVGYFDFPRWVRYFMWIWLVVAVLVGIPIFGLALSDLVRGTQFVGGTEGQWVGLVIAPAFLAYALLLPRIGRRFSRNGERHVLDFMETVLAAKRS